MTDTKLYSKAKEKYGDQYDHHLFEQYKIYIESAEKISDRRQNANNYFITINTALITLLGLSFQIDFFGKLFWGRTLLAVVGIIICVIFWFLLRSYKQLNSGKFKVIHAIEKELPLALYDYEWKILGKGKDNKKYYPFSHIELLIPWVFGIIYALLGWYFLC
ncbi:hypothetical protein KKD03_00625 [Patescibacteria group bacterium]|nr:hypothetical protein [Patescibacteria group bacterium]